jgi:hypothetical protein
MLLLLFTVSTKVINQPHAPLQMSLKEKGPQPKTVAGFPVSSLPTGYGFLCVDDAINCMFCLLLDEWFAEKTKQ